MKEKYRIIFLSIVIIICLIGFIYSLYHIFKWKKDVDDNHNIKDNLDKHINKRNDTLDVDFNSLKKINGDTIAYLKVNDTNIDYVVVKGNDNSYYLKHNFKKEYNVAGWVFADYHNNFDDTDKNIVIYGHNTKDGSMFETLINVLNKKWQENKNNHVITLVTEKGVYKYNVFSTYMVEPEEYYINTVFSDKEYTKFLNTVKKRSNYNYNIEINSNDKVLTLSSCVGEGSKRVVLHAKLIK